VLAVVVVVAFKVLVASEVLAEAVAEQLQAGLSHHNQELPILEVAVVVAFCFQE
jgi:hypothetical protein